jgi:type II secretory pathway component GspD/PulD (secretin)
LILLSLLSVGPIGCATGKKRLQRKSIEQLYLEAVRARANQISEVKSSKGSDEVVWEEVVEEEVSLQQPAKSIVEKHSDTNTLPQLRRHEKEAIQIEGATLEESTEIAPEQATEARHLNKIFDETWPAKAVSYQEASAPEGAGPEGAGPEDAGTVKPASEVTYLYDKDWLGDDLVEAIQELALIGNVTVMIDENVGGEVTGTTKANTFEEALESILLPHSLYYTKEVDKYYIAPADPKSPMFRLISVHDEFIPLYQDVNVLLESLPDRLQVFAKKIASPDRILIDAPKPIIEEIKTRLQELDVLVPQVKLEAIVCFIAPEQGFQFGLDWNHAVKIDGQSSFNFGISGLSFSGLASQKGFQNTFSDYAVTSGFLKLLAREGYLTLRAAPSVVASTGKQATISISRETYFSLQPANAVNIFRQDVQTVNAGIVLNITPTIRGDTISVNLEKAEVSEDVRTNDSRPELNSNPYPIINRRTVSTTVNVKDGETLVIGGLVQRQTVDRINRVVGLSDIPMLGNLFRTVEKQEQDVEVAIFISPSLVRE